LMMTNKNIRKFWPSVVLAGSFATWLAAGNGAAYAQDSTAQATQDSAIPGQRTDGQIEMDVVHALDAAPSLQQDWITAATVQGEVTLSGTSATEANRRLAESIASKVPGVTKVVNNLKVGDPQAAQAADPAGPEAQYPDQTPQMGANNVPQQPQAPIEPQTGQSYPPSDYPPPPQQGGRPNYQPPNNQQPNYPQPNYPQPNYQPVPNPSQYAQVPEHPVGPATLPQGTVLAVRTSHPLDSHMAQNGTQVEFSVARDVYAGGVLAIPRGATILGQVTYAKQAGALAGSPQLELTLLSLQLEGRSYALNTDPYLVKGPDKGVHTAGNAIGGALLGALIGGAVGGGQGAAIGAGAGAVGGTAASAATPGPRVWIPSEALLDFHLNADLTLTPVSRQEAIRLAASQPSARPTLYRRGPYPYPYGYPPPPPPPGYYYRPY
jgi:hypothetical protein